jgi:hypothetical protein
MSVSPFPNPQVGGSPLVGCPKLLIQYIHSQPSYLEVIFSICNLRICHAMLTGTHITWSCAVVFQVLALVVTAIKNANGSKYVVWAKMSTVQGVSNAQGH